MTLVVSAATLRLCRHVVARALANQFVVLWALADVARGDSPSVVSRRYGVSKSRLRGWIQRVQEATGVFGWERKYLCVYEALLRMRVRPVVSLTRSGLRCTLCGFTIREYVMNHVVGVHSDVVDSWVTYLMSVLG